MVLSGPVAVFAVLLIVAGMAKAWRPAPTTAALAAAGLPAGRPLVILLGLLEVAVGAGVVLVATTLWLAAMTGLYLGFAAFIVAALRVGATGSCGCFGGNDTPPSLAHLALNLAGSTTAALAWAAGVPSLVDTLASQPAGGAPFVGVTVLAVASALLVMTELPKTMVAVRRPGR